MTILAAPLVFSGCLWEARCTPESWRASWEDREVFRSLEKMGSPPAGIQLELWGYGCCYPSIPDARLDAEYGVGNHWLSGLSRGELTLGYRNASGAMEIRGAWPLNVKEQQIRREFLVFTPSVVNVSGLDLGLLAEEFLDSRRSSSRSYLNNELDMAQSTDTFVVPLNGTSRAREYWSPSDPVIEKSDHFIDDVDHRFGAWTFHLKLGGALVEAFGDSTPGRLEATARGDVRITITHPSRSASAEAASTLLAELGVGDGKLPAGVRWQAFC